MDHVRPVNPFPYPTALDTMRLKDVCDTAKKTYERGWNAGTAGNYSVRSTSKGIMWISPSGLCKGELEPKRFIPVQIANAQIIGPVVTKPSDETALHAGILRHRTDAVCIVHAHPKHLVRKSLDSMRLSFSGHEMQKALGFSTHQETVHLAMIENTQDMTTFGANVEKFLHPSFPFLILKGHGVYAWASDSEKALNLIEALEFLCDC